MFRAKLKQQLEKIFQLGKVTFDTPSESQEQEGIFVEISSARIRLKDARQIARVSGTIRVFAAADKLPFGFFVKKLDAADPEEKKGLVFFGVEENRGTFRNIVERSIEFQYFFDSQYDPAVGSIDSVTLSISES